MIRRSAPLAALALFLGASGLGCHGKAPPPPPPEVDRGIEVIAPKDHALPGELAEGSEKAFGFPLPRRLAIIGRFDDVVFARGDVPPEIVANYVRARVAAEHVETGPAKTVFTRATAKADPSHTLRIDVGLRDGDTELTVRDETRPPAREGLSEAERWKQLGLAPDGTPLDPTHLE